MRSTTQTIPLFVAVLATAGCYQGLAANAENAGGPSSVGGDTGSDGDPGQQASSAGGEDGDSGGNGDGDGGGNGDAEPFTVPQDEVRLMPLPVRMANLASIAGVGLDHPMFAEANELRLLLGGHDFSQLASPDLRWTAERMQNWVRAVKPICASAELQARYPNLATDPTPLMREAFGREVVSQDVESLLDIQAAPTLDDEAKNNLTCLAVLSALEFVAY